MSDRLAGLSFKRPFMIALTLHVVLVLALTVQYHPQQKQAALPMPAAQQPPAIVQAVAVNQADVEAQITRIEQEKETQRLAEQQHVAAIQAQARAAQTQQAQAAAQLAALKSRQKKMHAELAKAKREQARSHQRAVAEKRRLTQLKQQQAKMSQKLAAEKLAAIKVKKQQAEALAQAKRTAADQAKKLAAAKAAKLEAQRQQQRASLAKQRELAAQQAMQNALKQEQAGLAAEHAQVVASEVAKYKGLIVGAISHHWRVPPAADKHLVCQLLIRLAPGGVVLDVKLLKSSGDPLLDRSARHAVLKASPLPVPSKAEIFDQFRELRLSVRPEQVI